VSGIEQAHSSSTPPLVRELSNTQNIDDDVCTQGCNIYTVLDRNINNVEYVPVDMGGTVDTLTVEMGAGQQEVDVGMDNYTGTSVGIIKQQKTLFEVWKKKQMGSPSLSLPRNSGGIRKKRMVGKISKNSPKPKNSAYLKNLNFFKNLGNQGRQEVVGIRKFMQTKTENKIIGNGVSSDV
jgi:hypothetical protein